MAPGEFWNWSLLGVKGLKAFLWVVTYVWPILGQVDALLWRGRFRIFFLTNRKAFRDLECEAKMLTRKWETGSSAVCLFRRQNTSVSRPGGVCVCLFVCPSVRPSVLPSVRPFARLAVALGLVTHFVYSLSIQLKFDTAELIGILEFTFNQLKVDPSKHKVSITKSGEHLLQSWPKLLGRAALPPSPQFNVEISSYRGGGGGHYTFLLHD